MAIAFAQVGSTKSVLYSVAADGALFVWEQEEEPKPHTQIEDGNADSEEDEEEDEEDEDIDVLPNGAPAISRTARWVLNTKHLFGQSYAQVTSAQVSTIPVCLIRNANTRLWQHVYDQQCPYSGR